MQNTFPGSVRGISFFVSPAKGNLNGNCWIDWAKLISILPGAKGVRWVNQVNILCSLSNGCWASSLVKTNLDCALALNTLVLLRRRMQMTDRHINYACDNYIQRLDRELCLTAMRFAEAHCIKTTIELVLFVEMEHAWRVRVWSGTQEEHRKWKKVFYFHQRYRESGRFSITNIGLAGFPRNTTVPRSGSENNSPIQRRVQGQAA